MSAAPITSWQQADVGDTVILPDGTRKRIVKSRTLCSARIIDYDDGTHERWYRRAPWRDLGYQLERAD